jgi:hypothetical protein
MADAEESIGEPEESQAPELPKVDYSSNSYKNRDKSPRVPHGETVPQDKKITKVIDSDVVQRRKPLGKKIAETFSGDNMHEVGEYVLYDLVIPGVRDLLFDILTQGLQRKLYGDVRGRRIATGLAQAGQTTMKVAYNRISSPNSPTGRAGQPDGLIDMSRRGRANHDFNEIVIADRGEAERVLDTLVELVAMYGSATVYDLYELCGITGQFPDQKWGWDDLRASRVDRVREGHLLNLPKPKPMD